MRPSLLLPLTALMLLAACDSAETPAPDATATETAAAPAATPSMVSPMTPASPGDIAAMDIPAAIQGRWGMVPADCEPGRADAKGLLVIGPRRLEFYESVGTLDDLEEMTPTRIRGDFDFTGEGMEWDRDVTLDVQDEGRTLIRREEGENAEPGPYRYTKCA